MFRNLLENRHTDKIQATRVNGRSHGLTSVNSMLDDSETMV